VSAEDQSQQQSNNQRASRGLEMLERSTRLRLVFDTAALQGIASNASCVAQNLLNDAARFGVSDALFLAVVVIDEL
jgi:hypothetical protein